MPELSQALSEKEFVVTVETDPPRGVETASLLKLAEALAGRVDAVVVSDHRGACPRQSPIWAGHLLNGRGMAVVLTMSCRDRNRLALTGDILAAAAAGLREILFVSGDFVTLGDHPGARPVYDLDSVQALQLAEALRAGGDLSGHPLEGAPDLIPGAAAALEANPLEAQLIKVRKKVQAGARFFITQPLRGVESLRAYLERAGKMEPPLIAGVEAAGPDEIANAARLFAEIRDSGLARGAHLTMPSAQSRLPELLKACGL